MKSFLNLKILLSIQYKLLLNQSTSVSFVVRMEISPMIEGIPVGTARNIRSKIKICFIKMMKINKENSHILHHLQGA